MLAVDVLRTPDALRAVRDDWDALCDASELTTPFQRPGWAVAWASRMGVTTPETFTVREGRDLVGLLPAFVWGSHEARTLSLLGAGPSDHLDALAAPGYGRGVVDAIREIMGAPDRTWDRWAFDEVGPRALLRELPAPDGAAVSASPQSVCPVLAITGGGAGALEATVPAAQAARLRKAGRRCARQGGARFQRADTGDFAAALRLVFELHGRRWALRDAPGCFADPRVVALHEEAAVDFARRRALRLYILHVAGRAAAGVYGFREGRRLHLYAQGIDPAFEALSPGLLALGAVVADAIEDGIREVDFLRGAERYKYDWGAVDEANVRLTWAAASN